MKQLTAKEFLSLFDPSVHDQIKAAAKRYPNATAVVCFENLDMCSSELGHRSALVVGPDNTFTSVEDCRGKHLNDLPSQRQYPVSWCPTGELNG